MDILVLQTGESDRTGEMILPQTSDIRWRRETRTGEPVETIVSAARDSEAEMVVMTTHGPLGLMARMRGSRTDRVLHDLRLPLLSIPVL